MPVEFQRNGGRMGKTDAVAKGSGGGEPKQEDWGTIEDPGEVVHRDPKKAVKKVVKKEVVKASEKVKDLDTEDEALEAAKKSLVGKGTRTWQAYEEAARRFLTGRRKEAKLKKDAK
jgi:hypothetical protein